MSERRIIKNKHTIFDNLEFILINPCFIPLILSEASFEYETSADSKNKQLISGERYTHGYNQACCCDD